MPSAPACTLSHTFAPGSSSLNLSFPDVASQLVFMIRVALDDTMKVEVARRQIDAFLLRWKLNPLE